MGRLYRNDVKRVKNLPIGHIYGAKLTFPVPTKIHGVLKKVMTVLKVQARMVRVLVQEPTEEGHWAKGLGGTERSAIECIIRTPDIEETIYLDNDDGETLWKVTGGKGHPGFGLKQLPVERTVDDPTIAGFYRIETVENGVYRLVTGRRAA